MRSLMNLSLLPVCKIFSSKVIYVNQTDWIAFRSCFDLFKQFVVNIYKIKQIFVEESFILQECFVIVP